QRGVISLSSPGWNFVTLFAMAVLVLGLPAFVAAQLARDIDDATLSGVSHLRVVFLGAAAGLTGWGLGLAQIIGPYTCGTLTAGLGLVVALVRSFRAAETSPAPSGSASTCSVPILDAPPVTYGHKHQAVTHRALSTTMAVACGGWTAVLGFL